jgi:phosphoenolpyruvate carboxykinase (GTP)
MRVLAWILDRVEGKVDARETPIGFLPNVSDIDIAGLDVSQDTMEALLGVDVTQWQEEVAAIGEYLDEYGARMPQAMKDELAKISTALQAKAKAA